MSKRNIIFICIAVAVVIVLAFATYFIIKVTTQKENKNQEKIILEKYDDNFEIEKTIEITKKKEIKELKEKYSNPSLEQDENTTDLAVRTDVKLDFGNGKFYVLQLNLQEYCYYEDAETNTKLAIKMPEGLLEKVNEILAN